MPTRKRRAHHTTHSVRMRRRRARKFAFCSGEFGATLKDSFGVACLSTPGDLPPHTPKKIPDAGVDDSVDGSEGYDEKTGKKSCREIRCAFYSLACRPRNMIMRTEKSNSQFVYFHCKIRTSLQDGTWLFRG